MKIEQKAPHPKSPAHSPSIASVPSVPLSRCAALLAALGALWLCGCQVLTYTGPNGERFSRSSLGATTAISALVVEAGSNGLRRVELRGYQNDSSQVLGIITESAVRAAIQAAK